MGEKRERKGTFFPLEVVEDTVSALLEGDAGHFLFIVVVVCRFRPPKTWPLIRHLLLFLVLLLFLSFLIGKRYGERGETL